MIRKATYSVLSRLLRPNGGETAYSPYDRGRRLCEGHPELALRSLDVYTAGATERVDEDARVAQILADLDALVDTEGVKNILVVGCGPHPTTVEVLSRRGFEVTAVEPVPAFAQSARTFVGARVLDGGAEKLPIDDESMDLVFLESVLEHVDSPRKSLEEAHRVLRPGGVVFVTTTNRHSLRLDYPEFNVRFFNWFPRLLRESYVFFHVHYRPSLANYTERPAVHWFSFADLCALGRDAGFAQFYSHFDLRREQPSPSQRTIRRGVRSLLLRGIQTRPLMRTLALIQRGGEIFMLKRPLP